MRTPANKLVKIEDLAKDLVEFENLTLRTNIEDTYQSVWNVLNDINKEDKK
jgi:hypothetical protein